MTQRQRLGLLMMIYGLAIMFLALYAPDGVHVWTALFGLGLSGAGTVPFLMEDK